MLIPGAIYDPGRHWNGEAGWADMRALFWHYTVGRNSISICRDNGLSQTLVRDEGIYQFAPANAVCFTQCEWNRVGAGEEVESMDGSFTSDAQLQHHAYLTQWYMATFGIPPNFHTGYRLPVGTPFYGVTNHRDLQHRSCDQHYDGFDQWVWEYVTGTPAQGDDGVKGFFIRLQGTMFTWYVSPDGWKMPLTNRFHGDSMAYAGLTSNSVDGAHEWTQAMIDSYPVRTEHLKGFFVRVAGDPVAYFVSPHGWKLALTNQTHADLMSYVQFSSNTLANAFPWSREQVDAFPLWDPDAVPSGGGGGGGGTIPTNLATKEDVAASEQRVRADVNKPRTSTGTVQ